MLIKFLSKSIVETVQFYADSGDLLSAAYISLVFYDELTSKPMGKYKAYLSRILIAYYDMLDQRKLYHLTTELRKHTMYAPTEKISESTKPLIKYA